LDAMTAAASAFLDGLGEAQRAAAQRPMTDEERRRDWTYLPGRREGLSLGDLDRAGRKAVHRLVATALRAHAYAQVAAIMALEDVLDHAEGNRRGRHSSDYWAIVFGEPASGEPWSWRFEGHHVSLNVTVASGEVSATPSFLGANPATITRGQSAVLRPLIQEEELARALLDAMDPRCRTAAVVADLAPADLRTRRARRVSTPIEPLGVPRRDLSTRATDLLDRLVDTFIERLPDDLADAENARIDRKTMHFAGRARRNEAPATTTGFKRRTCLSSTTTRRTRPTMSIRSGGARVGISARTSCRAGSHERGE